MYKVEDWIIYGNTGACQVMSVGRPEGRGVLEAGKEYYELSPMLDSSTIFAPVDTKVFIRPVISREEAEALIDGIPEIGQTPFCNSSPRLLTEHYKEALQSHNCEDLLRLIKGAYEKTQACVRNGKRPGQIDQRYKKRAEELLHSELSVALAIPYREVEGYITSRVEALEVSAG